jgi:hypothetical protein
MRRQWLGGRPQGGAQLNVPRNRIFEGAAPSHLQKEGPPSSSPTKARLSLRSFFMAFWPLPRIND